MSRASGFPPSAPDVSPLCVRIMSPTIFHERGFRFLFFSREEPRLHVHIQSPKGEAKYWLEPDLILARSNGFSEKDLRIIESIIKEHEDEIRSAWRKHFKA